MTAIDTIESPDLESEPVDTTLGSPSETVDAATDEVLADDDRPVDATADDATIDDATIDDATIDDAPRSRSIVAVALAVLTSASLVFAVIAGVVWWRADHDPARAEGRVRDQAILAARLEVQAVSTSDYRHPDATLADWLSVSTGVLHKQFAQSKASAVTLLRDAKVITTSTVLDAAVLTLDTKKGTATVIASVNLRKQPANGPAATSRNRLRASLTRVSGQWKLSDLTLVSVQVS